jgi:hypothetical protein
VADPVTRRVEEADLALQNVMQAYDSVFWHQDQWGDVIIHAPKKRGDHREYQTLKVDKTRLELMRYRIDKGEPLQDFEALDAVEKPKSKPRRRLPRGRGSKLRSKGF